MQSETYEPLLRWPLVAVLTLGVVVLLCLFAILLLFIDHWKLKNSNANLRHDYRRVSSRYRDARLANTQLANLSDQLQRLHEANEQLRNSLVRLSLRTQDQDDDDRAGAAGTTGRP
jgi:F0F1-type ATP synthase membrane subunit b/b'